MQSYCSPNPLTKGFDFKNDCENNSIVNVMVYEEEIKMILWNDSYSDFDCLVQFFSGLKSKKRTEVWKTYINASSDFTQK